MKLKILSWNIWCYGNLDQVADFLKTSDADIICLQEVLPKEDLNIINFLNKLGYGYSYDNSIKIEKDGKMVNMGNATFTKHKMIANKTHVLSKKESRIALESTIEVNGVLLNVFNAHLTHAHLKESEERDRQMDILIKLLPKDKTLVMGDFNSLPESSTVQKINKILINTDPSLSPTWSNYPKGCPGCFPQSLQYRLDYIFVSKDITFSSPTAYPSKASDHLPVSVVIEV